MISVPSFRAGLVSALSLAAASLVLTSLVLPGVALSAEPQLTLAAHGVLRSMGGGPVADGKYVMTFSLHNAATGGKLLWSELHPVVSVKGGSFQVRLGASAAAKQTLDQAKLPWDKPLWLGFRVSDDPELPRARLGSVSLAAHALSAGAVTGAIDGKQIADASIAAKTLGFAYAGANIKGGPAVNALSAELAKDLKCTACVSVSEMDFDGDIKLGSHSLQADKIVTKTLESGSVSAATVLAKALTATQLSSDTLDAKAAKMDTLAANNATLGEVAASTVAASTVTAGKVTAQAGAFGVLHAVTLSGGGAAITGIVHPPNPAGSCKVGEVVSGIDKAGTILCAKLPESGLKGINSKTAQVCDANKRGTLWFEPRNGASDKLSVCGRDSAGSYAWRKLYGSDPKAIQTGKCTSHSNFCGGPNNTCKVTLKCPAGQLLTQVRLLTQNCNGCTPSGNGDEQKQCAGKAECSMSFKHSSGCCCDSDDYRTGYAKAICL
jgi:hypothetical protein